MTKKEQLKFIEDNYPLYNNHITTGWLATEKGKADRVRYM